MQGVSQKTVGGKPKGRLKFRGLESSEKRSAKILQGLILKGKSTPINRVLRNVFSIATLME